MEKNIKEVWELVSEETLHKGSIKILTHSLTRPDGETLIRVITVFGGDVCHTSVTHIKAHRSLDQMYEGVASPAVKADPNDDSPMITWLPDPRMPVYCYHHIDLYDFFIDPAKVYDAAHAKAALDIVRKRFLEAGWEGDGKIMLIWLPPFIPGGTDDGLGALIWHVKQYNNGTSYIGGNIGPGENMVKVL